MRVMWRRAAYCRERNSACGAAILAGVLAGVIGLAAPWSAPTQAAEECLTQPGGPAPAGKHWFYSTDRATKRKCWFLDQVGGNGRERAAKRSPASDAAAAPDEIPLPPPRAMARDVPSDALDEPNPDPQEAAKAIPHSEPAMRLSAEDPESTPDGGADHRRRTAFLNEPLQAWSLFTAAERDLANTVAERDFANPPPPRKSEPLPLGERPLGERATDGHSKMSFAGEPPLARPVVDTDKPTVSRDTAGHLDVLALFVFTLSLGGALLGFALLRRPADAWCAWKKEPEQTAEYVSALSRLVASLNPDTAEARRAAYDRAWRALIDGLHEIDPPLPQATIAVEQSAFEAAVRRVEAKRRRPVALFLRLMRRARSWTRLDNAGARLSERAGEAVARMTRQRHSGQTSP